MLASLAASDTHAQMIRFLKPPLLVAYGVYAWITFLAIGLIALFFLLLTPSLKARRILSAGFAKLWLRIAFIFVELRGAERLPAIPSVLVANHSSYIDGVLMKAILPARYCFVIKKEMMKVPLAGLLLRRIGAEFVDRFNRQAGAMDARRLMRAASGGGSLVFFPEGTFTSEPGLAKFHGGAFTIAARNGMPVVPVVIRGARNILRGDTILPRPGRIEVEVLDAIEASAGPESDAGSLAAQLRDQSRARILAVLGEPDLKADGVALLAGQRTLQESEV
jgi:1-acyl-sn-glycerol-3-phosphate acyltransferase